jgi:predicted FMN-binding regulatory protein PaiB
MVTEPLFLVDRRRPRQRRHPRRQFRPLPYDASKGIQLGAQLVQVVTSRQQFEVQRCPSGTPVMVVFRCARAYVSPNWCPSKHEAAEPTPWKMADSAPEFIDGMLRNIVGIQIAVTSLVGKSKLSQNKELRDRHSAADTLASRGHDELARAMRGTP